ncbi:hypothetical protein EMIT0324P_11136 [Pseudomonas chlororaphis]|uniref:hypothetical protein n=1 Tax=Pseudomonas chlororaphis TaxID=587753 RepID=UPI0039E5DC87
MNTLKLVQPYLLEPGDSVNPTDRECYRLTSDDKRQIEAAIEKHGAGALENVTKGGAMLYLRFPMRFAGEDEEYLRSLFAPETLKQRPWDGPEQIVLNVRDTGKIGVDGKRIQLVETFNPFVERYYRLPYRNMLPPSGDIVGYRFMAMPWRKNRLHVLQQHGRIECIPPGMLPIFIEEDWQGGWIGITKHQIEFKDWQQMSSDIGTIPANGGDYLRFLLMAKTIGATRCSYQEKLGLLEGMRIMCGADGHFFDEFIERVGGFRGLAGIMETECENDDEEGEDE